MRKPIMSYSLDVATVDQLKVLSEKTGVSRSEIIRRLVAQAHKAFAENSNSNFLVAE